MFTQTRNACHVGWLTLCGFWRDFIMTAWIIRALFNEDAVDGSMLLWRSRKIYTISIASLKMIQSMVVTHLLCSHSVRQQIMKNKQRITCRVFYILFGNWYRAKTCHNVFLFGVCGYWLILKPQFSLCIYLFCFLL